MDGRDGKNAGNCPVSGRFSARKPAYGIFCTGSENWESESLYYCQRGSFLYSADYSNWFAEVSQKGTAVILE